MQWECIAMMGHDRAAADELLDALQRLQCTQAPGLVAAARLARAQDGTIRMTQTGCPNGRPDAVPLDIAEADLWAALLTLHIPQRAQADMQQALQADQVVVVAVIDRPLPESVARALTPIGGDGSLNRYQIEPTPLPNIPAPASQPAPLPDWRHDQALTRAEVLWQATLDKLDAQLRAWQADIAQFRLYAQHVRDSAQQIQLEERITQLCARRDEARDTLHAQIAGQMHQWQEEYYAVQRALHRADDLARAGYMVRVAALQHKLERASHRLQASLAAQIRAWETDSVALRSQLAQTDGMTSAAMGDPSSHLGDWRSSAWCHLQPPLEPASEDARACNKEVAMKTILIPLDGSELAEQVLPVVPPLARMLRAGVHLLRVVEDADVYRRPTDYPSPHYPLYGYAMYGHAMYAPTLEAEDESALCRRAHEQVGGYLEGLAQSLRIKGLEVTTSVQFGDPAAHIVELATSQQAAMIAMVTHGDSGIRRWVRGSVTERVIQTSHTPVFIMHAQARPVAEVIDTLQHILVPLDGSDLARQVLPIATELARQTGAEIHLLRVVAPRMAMTPALIAGDIPRRFHDDMMAQDAPAVIADEHTYAHGHQYLEAMAGNLRQTGLPVVTHVRAGAPAEQIVSQAAAQEQTLIVMATHGYSGIQRWLHGSVATSVLRATRTPLVLLHGQQNGQQN